MNTTIFPEGRAVVYCDGMFNTPSGKTAHGLVRFTKRYQVLSVIDSGHAGKDAGEVLDGKASGIPICATLDRAVELAHRLSTPATHFVIGLAPDGGRLSDRARDAVKLALEKGLNVDCGLHDFLSEDPTIAALASRHGVRIRDVRKPPPVADLHFFTGKIETVDTLKVAVLGTDSAIGKRTTAWILVNGLNHAGISAEMIGTGQTAWMQGVQYGIIMDSLINDYVSGEIEHAVWRAWDENKPEVIVIEGQGSLMNPAYPGGFEILAAGRPDVIVLQHAPNRLEYDGFPGYPIHPIKHQIAVLEMLSGRPVVAVTINHENMRKNQIASVCKTLQYKIMRPVFDVLQDGPYELLKTLRRHLKKH